MNQKLQSLIDKSRVKEKYRTWDEYTNTYATAEWYVVDPEKLAELIVRDCANWLAENNGHDGPSPSQLLEHFGVEE